MHTHATRWNGEDVLVAAAAGWALSGLPSTLWTLASGGDVLASSRAAGTMVLGERRSSAVLVAAGLTAHTALSLGWATVLGAALPRRRTAGAGAVAGLAIALFDLGAVGRRFPAVHALDQRLQVADHVAFGAVVGAVLAHRRARRAGSSASGSH